MSSLFSNGVKYALNIGTTALSFPNDSFGEAIVDLFAVQRDWMNIDVLSLFAFSLSCSVIIAFLPVRFRDPVTYFVKMGTIVCSSASVGLLFLPWYGEYTDAPLGTPLGRMLTGDAFLLTLFATFVYTVTSRVDAYVIFTGPAGVCALTKP